MLMVHHDRLFLARATKNSNLTKIAEVAGKRIKKLRRNWSLKKDDISKGLSKIKRSSKPLIEVVYDSREGLTFISKIYEKN